MPRRTPRPEPRPWSAEEDACLREACAAGASSDLWATIFPDRSFGDVAARRLDLKPRMAPLL